MAKARFVLPNLNKMLEQYQGASSRVDEVARECIEQGMEYMYVEMALRLAEHQRTGRALKSLKRKPINREGTIYSSSVGVYFDAEDNGGYMHAVYQEYGTPTFKKDPWLRPVMDAAPKHLKNIYADIIREKLGEP